ncbi:TSC22 domain family protein 3-like isoform X4 [Amphibalanus amphitrite]|uniref:TSC22 domain family protein 3-like isoform X4 n=1 Tax=Amphibalanus amphitrite TaxID=1232801 RepID=UPI001C904304|nr:TSC22 domain family protein 3-like isoform X4 [Amphibalanus amphitrite]
MTNDRWPALEADVESSLISSLSDSLTSLASLGSLGNLSASPGGSSLDNKIEPIDNKIEQAMDLVKSHLLLAVREEVDVLKANITKLVDKISVLERENEVLKTNASPEVLAKLAERPAAPPAAGQSAPGHRVA